MLALTWFTRPAAAADPWLFVTDIHFSADIKGRLPSIARADTNRPLLESAIAEMQRASPHPPVVVVGGDLLAHVMNPKHAASTMAFLAQRLDRAFPDAQFVLVLGNDDSECGDYGIVPNSPFLAGVARAWGPLVNRHGAAPDFVKSFSRTGSYVATLPVPKLRAVVVNDVYWSWRYRPGCGRDANVAVPPLSDIERLLQHGPGERNWVLMHIPPGIDADSTAYRAHRLLIVPWLNPGPREVLLSLGNPENDVSLFVTGHTHKFAYRIVDPMGRSPVPMLLIPSISPIFSNAPSFLTVRVGPGGVLTAVTEISESNGRWREIGTLQDLGISSFTGAELRDAQSRLQQDPKLRAKFAELYSGGAPAQVNESNWRIYWCAAQEYSATAFRACMHEEGLSVLTRRGLYVLVVAAAVLLLVIAVLIARMPRPSNR